MCVCVFVCVCARMQCGCYICTYTCTRIRLSVCLPACVSSYPSIHPTNQPSIHPSIHPSMNDIYLSISLPLYFLIYTYMQPVAQRHVWKAPLLLDAGARFDASPRRRCCCASTSPEILGPPIYPLLGGSWVVISGVIFPLITNIGYIYSYPTYNYP